MVNQTENPTPPPVIENPPPTTDSKPSAWRKVMAATLSLFLLLFIAGGLVSILDDLSGLTLGIHIFTAVSALLTFLICLVTMLVYGLMGLTPIISKRVVLPVVLFMGLTLLATFPVMIYSYHAVLVYDLGASFATVAVGLLMVRWLQGSWRWRWPLVPVQRLGKRAFSWLNLLGFVFLNFFVLLPVAVFSLGAFTGMAISHYTEGFVSLRPSGIVMKACRYKREDGKTILLFPMSHIAEPDFYRNVMQSVSSNSVVLLEGVTDTNNLLVHKLNYRRAAKSLHLAEQHDAFDLQQGELVHADVDVSEFSTNTLALLSIVTLMHTEGLNAHTLSLLLGYAPSPDMEQQLLNDLLLHRNAHVLGVLHERLGDSSDFVIPWGAAHMMGISEEIEKSGFRLVESRDFVAIRFGHKGQDADPSGADQETEKSK